MGIDAETTKALYPKNATKNQRIKNTIEKREIKCKILIVRFLLLISLFISDVALASSLNVGLLAHYEFNGNSNDSSSNSRNLIFRDATQTSYVYSGFFNKQVLSISGNNRADYFTAPDPYVSGIPKLTINQTTTYSYGMWIKPTSIGRNNPEWTYLIESASGSGLRYGESSSQGNLREFGYYFINDFNTNNWTHVAVTKTESIWSLYYMGELVGSTSTSGEEFDKNNFFLFNSGGYQYQFNGQVSDVVIYDRALTSSEVAQLVPEPSALSLLAVGLGGLAMMRRRRS